MAGHVDVVASFDVLGQTTNIAPAPIFVTPSAGFYACAINFNTHANGGGFNYEVVVSHMATLGNNGTTNNLNSFNVLYLEAGVEIDVSSDTAGNPMPSPLNFDFHVVLLKF